MVSALFSKDHRLAVQILDDDVDVSVVEEIAEGRAAADLWCLNRRTHEFADIAKRAIASIQEEEFWLPISCTNIESIHLGVDMSVHQKKIRPTIIVKVEK